MKAIFRYFAWSIATLAMLLGFAYFYFAYAPIPAAPPLSGKLSQYSIAFGGLQRSYEVYVPASLKPGSPLVVVMHGSGGSGTQMRSASGYEFDRLADQHGFVVFYPDAFEGVWNACNKVGDFESNKRNIDDTGFINAVIEKLISTYALASKRVFATGHSRGGAMALRLALEDSDHVRAVAAISANFPVDSNSKCLTAGRGVSVMIMNGTADPLNPFDGGLMALFGTFMSRGDVRSSSASANFFADLNGITSPPETSTTAVADGLSVERSKWSGGDGTEVELVAIHGGGHVIPQPYYRYPRFLGPTPEEPNGPDVIWKFFENQKSGP